jgi:hypothetical protein
MGLDASSAPTASPHIRRTGGLNHGHAFAEIGNARSVVSITMICGNVLRRIVICAPNLMAFSTMLVMARCRSSGRAVMATC